MLDRTEQGFGGHTAQPSAPLPVADLVIGKPVEEAAALLPRLFNLCRTAQQAAARLAFGLPLGEGVEAALNSEVLRDHLVKFYLKWPALLGRASVPLPANWQRPDQVMRRALFGPQAMMPTRPEDTQAFLGSYADIARVLTQIDQCFEAGEACTHALPGCTAQSVLQLRAQENSVAGRHSAHPVMQYVAETRGRGPLWRAMGRAYDLEACLNGALPALEQPDAGTAIVPAARGAYAIRARVAAGKVTAFRRITPTDHLLAEGGILEQSLASLPRAKAGFAPLLMDILDPCSPVRLKDVPLKEVDHA